MKYSISIIGSGTMGTSIAQLFSIKTNDNISQVNIIGSSESLTKANKTIDLFLQKQIIKKKVDQNCISSFKKNFTFTTEFNSLKQSNFIIEAITENLSKKKQLISKISSYTQDSSIVASNTSSLSITELASCYKKPENFIGLHFFNPATLMELNEVIVGFNTEEETLTKTLNLSRLLKKSPVIVNESPGFIVNRMLIPMLNEAITILAEGVASADDIDKAMKLGAHHPMGPLSLADFIGNDVNLSIMETLFKETGDPKYRPHPLLRKMVRANHLGRKTKQGFFKY